MLNILAKIRPLSRAVHHRSGINYNGPERTKTDKNHAWFRGCCRKAFSSYVSFIFPPFVSTLYTLGENPFAFFKNSAKFLSKSFPPSPSVRSIRFWNDYKNFTDIDFDFDEYNEKALERIFPRRLAIRWDQRAFTFIPGAFSSMFSRIRAPLSARCNLLAPTSLGSSAFVAT